MAFHPCSGVGIFLVLSAVILLIFAEIGQTGHSSVPQKIRIVSLSTTNFGTGLAAATGQSGNLTELYAPAGRAPDANGTGIAQIYEWGLWSYCEGEGTLGSKKPSCIPAGNQWGHKFQPSTALFADIPTAYQTPARQVIPSITFTDEKYLSSFSRIAFYFIFVGALIAGLALFIGFGAHRFAYLFTAALAFLAAILIAVGGIIWSVIIAKVKSSINNLGVTGGVPLGLYVNYGNALWMIWAAVGALLLSVLPFFLACCTGRNKSSYY